MTQDELKQAVAQAAADYVAQTAPDGGIVGVGTGSTAKFFIDALAAMKDTIAGRCGQFGGYPQASGRAWHQGFRSQRRDRYSRLCRWRRRNRCQA